MMSLFQADLRAALPAPVSVQGMWPASGRSRPACDCCADSKKPSASWHPQLEQSQAALRQLQSQCLRCEPSPYPVLKRKRICGRSLSMLVANLMPCRSAGNRRVRISVFRPAADQNQIKSMYLMSWGATGTQQDRAPYRFPRGCHMSTKAWIWRCRTGRLPVEAGHYSFQAQQMYYSAASIRKVTRVAHSVVGHAAVPSTINLGSA